LMAVESLMRRSPECGEGSFTLENLSDPAGIYGR
jgi:hypothetical protein